jgi:hypothetical protein
MVRRRIQVVSGRKQLEALVSPIRQELVDTLSRMGTASVAEIGAALGRPADGLYYHLRALQRADLVVSARARSRNGRQEALFRTVAPVVALRYPRAGRGRNEPLPTIVASMLRLGIRDFRRAYGGGRAVLEGPRQELWALRATGWLSPAELAGINRRIRDLRDAIAGPRRDGRLYGITVLLTPLDHRARKRQARPRAGKRRLR